MILLIHATTAELLKTKRYTIIIGDEGRTGNKERRRFWLKGVQQVKCYAINRCTLSKLAFISYNFFSPIVGASLFKELIARSNPKFADFFKYTTPSENLR